MTRISSRVTALMSAVMVAASLSACAPLLIGGAMVGGSLMATDRRTSGTQIEDQAIELKARNRTREVLGDRGNVSTISYNRLVLITGEVPTEADKAAVEQTIGRIDNVRGVVNELALLGSSSTSSRSNDLLLSSKVKATLIDARDLQANAFKVTTERGTVYLMGRVTETEANRAVELIRSISGVQKVVRLFDVITDAELAELQPSKGNAQRAPSGRP